MTWPRISGLGCLKGLNCPVLNWDMGTLLVFIHWSISMESTAVCPHHVPVDHIEKGWLSCPVQTLFIFHFVGFPMVQKLIYLQPACMKSWIAIYILLSVGQEIFFSGKGCWKFLHGVKFINFSGSEFFFIICSWVCWSFFFYHMSSQLPYFPV